jgi:hypothetical protein
MLGNAHFYNRTIRKVVVAFGTLFNDILLVRYDKNNNTQMQMRVPLSYGPKEKYITHLSSNPSLNKSISVLVPRMSFNLDGLSYDVSRKQVTTLQSFNNTDTDGIKSQYVPIPYDFDFSFSIYVRNTEDGTQILEQILPFFTPDFTVTVDFVNQMDRKYDIPIILKSVSSSVDYEGDMLTTRLIIWDLTFTAKGYIWPPVKGGGVAGANNLIAMYSDVGGANGTGGYGFVKVNLYEDPTLNIKEAQIVVQSNPLNAEPDDEFGFSTTITEWDNGTPR